MGGEPLDCRRRRGRSALLAAAAAAAACLLAHGGPSLVAAEAVADEPTPPLQCSRWARGPAEPVPAASVNDGYCDCPFDGLDEPGTGACSGSMDGGWAGIPASVPGPAVDSPNGQFQCPQQGSLALPLSRVNDGICDCCDGADEPTDACPDDCERILAAERAARAKVEADFVAGSTRRREEMEEFVTMAKETVAEIEKLTKTKLPGLEEEVRTLDASIHGAKLKYMKERFDAGKQVIDSVKHIGEAASVDEIRAFIVSACHLSGEMSDADSSVPTLRNRRTCLPLRLAGLDVGFIWEDEDLDEYTASFRRMEGGGSDMMTQIADLLDKNSADDGKLSVGKDDNAVKRQDHRRYDHDEPDDYDHDEYGRSLDDDAYPYEEDDDDYNRHPEEEDEHLDSEGGSDADNTESVETKTSEVAQEEEKSPKQIREEGVKAYVQSTSIYKSRNQFALHAKKMKDKMDAIQRESSESTTDADDETKDSEADEEKAEDGESSESQPAPTVDPMAIQMARGTLDRRLKHLQRGEEFATSALVLLDAFEEAGKDDYEGVKRDMIHLAVGTVYHGHLDAGDVAELFYMLLPESQPEVGDNDETCTSQYAAMCPPRTFTRQSASLPPPLLVSAAEGRCEERSSAPAACSGEADGVTDADIPSNIPDGYAAYFVPKRRDDADPLVSVFSPMDLLSSTRAQLSELESAKEERDRELADVRSELRKLEDKIGGREEPKYGADGELYGLRDSCHSVESGKYEYEVCIFDKATQRDKGQKGGGTNLGRWSGMKRDDETGQIVLLWDKGTKCWNGPSRSATVFVTCGAETKLLTADEPRTCEYVFTMASHIACDEEFRVANDL